MSETTPSITSDEKGKDSNIDPTLAYVKDGADNEIKIDGLPVRIVNKRQWFKNTPEEFIEEHAEEIDALSKVFRNNPDLTDNDRFNLAMGRPLSALPDGSAPRPIIDADADEDEPIDATIVPRLDAMYTPAPPTPTTALVEHLDDASIVSPESDSIPKEASIFDVTPEYLPDELRATIYPEHTQPILNYLSIRYQDLIRKKLLDTLGQEKADEFDALLKNNVDEEQFENWEQSNISEQLTETLSEIWPALLDSKDFAEFRDFLTANIPVDTTFTLPTVEKSGDTEPRVPTDEELLRGFVLGKNEKVVFELFDSTNFNKSPDQAKGFKRQSIYIGKDEQVKVEGVHALAEVRVGVVSNFEDSVSITIYETREEGRLLVTFSGSDTSALLTSGSYVEVGRDVKALEDLNDFVSGEHCTIELDTEGRLVVTNYNPANDTLVRRFTH